MGWVALAVGSIWIAVAVISLNAEDLVYGADENTFPLVQGTTWIWGAIASAFVLNALVQRHPTGDDQYYASVGIAVASAVIWFVVTVVALMGPDFTFEFGDSSVFIPLTGILAPAAGVVATAVAGQYVPALTDVAASVSRREI
jgi:hypothetical protein